MNLSQSEATFSPRSVYNSKLLAGLLSCCAISSLIFPSLSTRDDSQRDLYHSKSSLFAIIAMVSLMVLGIRLIRRRAYYHQEQEVFWHCDAVTVPKLLVHLATKIVREKPRNDPLFCSNPKAHDSNELSQIFNKTTRKTLPCRARVRTLTFYPTRKCNLWHRACSQTKTRQMFVKRIAAIPLTVLFLKRHRTLW